MKDKRLLDRKKELSVWVVADETVSSRKVVDAGKLEIANWRRAFPFMVFPGRNSMLGYVYLEHGTNMRM